MTTIAERFKEIRQNYNLTGDQLAKIAGVTKQYISAIENGRREPSVDVAVAIADRFNFDLDYVWARSDTPNASRATDLVLQGYKNGLKRAKDLFKSISVYSCISCGSGSWIDEIPEENIGVPTVMLSPGREYFANPADGDSMEPLIYPGDYLIFEQADAVDSGKIGSFSLNGQYYCKRFKRYPDGSNWLLSENVKYEPIKINPEDDFRVLGIYRIKLSKEQ